MAGLRERASVCLLGSVDSQLPEQSTAMPLEFPEELIQQSLKEAQIGINDTEPPLMQDATAALHGHLYKRRRGADIDDGERMRRGTGVALAHRIIRYAADSVKVKLSINDAIDIEDFEVHFRDHPDELQRNFFEVYASHSTVTKLVKETLTNEHSKEGAMMVFTLYRRVTDPTLPPLKIPPRLSDKAALPVPQETKRPQRDLGFGSSAILVKRFNQPVRSGGESSNIHARRV